MDLKWLAHERWWFCHMTPEGNGEKVNIKEKVLIEAKANIFKALGHPHRLWMAEQLADGEKCVCELGEFIDDACSTISKHLAVLKQAGVDIAESGMRSVPLWRPCRMLCCNHGTRVGNYLFIPAVFCRSECFFVV